MGPSGEEGMGEAVGELSRGELLRKGAAGAGLVVGLAALGPYAARAMALPSTLAPGDVNILNYLLPFEYLQLSIYQRILSERSYKDTNVPLNEGQRELFEELLAQEKEHVAALRAMVEELGGKPIKPGDYAFAFVYLETAFFLANQVEGYAVGAYNYVIPKLKSKKAQELACTIVQVDARHAAILRQESKEEPAPFAFDYGVNEQGSVIEIEKFTGPSIYQEQGIE
jgi:hypothetical protein